MDELHFEQIQKIKATLAMVVEMDVKLIFLSHSIGTILKTK
jgi:hypothetical protein